MITHKISELEGALLDAAVAKGEGLRIVALNPPAFSSCWAVGGPIIDRDHIFLEPPHTVHALNYSKDGKPRGVWSSYETWHATVSARTRTWNTGPDDPALLVGGRVGRGEDPTALVAAMRAYVASKFGEYVELP